MTEEPDVMEERLDRLERDFDELSTVLLGPRRSALSGGGRDALQGIAHKIDVLWRESRNGGLKVNVPWGRITAGVSTIAALAAAIAGAFLDGLGIPL